MKKFYFTILILLFGFNYSWSQKITRLIIKQIEVSIDGKVYKSDEIKFLFQYGKKSPSQLLFTKDGVTIEASFNLTSPTTHRSELKNSSINFTINYNVKYMGSKRKKTSKRIYYYDSEQKFEASESFSYKKNKYDIMMITLKYNAIISD